MIEGFRTQIKDSMANDSPIDEAARIRQVYADRTRRKASKDRFFGYENLVHVCRLHNRYEETMRLLKEFGYHPLTGLRYLSVGCGTGRMVRQFVDWGCRPSHLAGIDLLEDSVEAARALTPNIDLRVGDARSMPWPDASFDLVGQSTVFSSILDTHVRKQIAAEMIRVLKPGGAVLWYDAFYNSPSNQHFRGIKASEIRDMFPGLQPHLYSTTLAAPLARRFPNALAPILYPILERVPLLRTHYLGLLIKPRTPASAERAEISH